MLDINAVLADFIDLGTTPARWFTPLGRGVEQSLDWIQGIQAGVRDDGLTLGAIVGGIAMGALYEHPLGKINTSLGRSVGTIVGDFTQTLIVDGVNSEKGHDDGC
jgi:hypothetical protein